MFHWGSFATRLQVATIMLAVIPFTAAISIAAADRGSQGTSAYAYVGSPGYAGDGSIFGFAVAPDGSAQPVPGSPLSGADGSLVGTGSYLFATDGKYIVTYTPATDGSLTQTSSADGTAYDQDPQHSSVQSLSLPPDGRNLYTDNWYVDGANNAYESWTVASSGQLSYLPSPGGMPLYSTAGGWPFSFTTDGHFAYTWSVCRWDGSVWGFTRRANGTLAAMNPNALGLPPFNYQGSSECSQGVAPSARGYAVVAWNGGFCCGGPTGIASYVQQNNGTLIQIPGSEIETPENAMAFDPSGQYLAVALNGGIQVYQLQSNGRLTAIGPVQEVAIPFSNLNWDNANHLYAITQASSQLCQNGNSSCGLYIFNARAGALTLAPGSPHTISQPGSLAVLPGS
jgi:hypothetical protein